LLKPFFSFYGSKWRLAPRYPPPRHDTVIEPFAGSAGYSLRYPDRDVILVDKDPNVTAVWRYLIAVSPEEIMALPEPKAGEFLNDFDLSTDARRLMGFWVDRAQRTPCNKVTEWGGNNGGMFAWKQKVARQLPAIRHWNVIEGDYASSPDMCATWFIDPPYQVAGRKYRHGAKGIDYALLAQWCRERNGQVIACENEGAEWLPFTPFFVSRAIPSYSVQRLSKEAVWLNEKAAA
jgi:hypothetical protein